jgi:hypothetical protein
VPRHLLSGGDADRAELAFDLSLDQAAELLAVLAGAPQQVLGGPADLPGLHLSLLTSSPATRSAWVRVISRRRCAASMPACARCETKRDPAAPT